MNVKHWLVSLALVLFWLLLGSPGVVWADDLTVCPEGPPTCDYTIIQDAVDAAAPGDVVKVAAGVYTDLNVRPRQDITTTGVVTQVVYLTKSLTIQGGYTTTNWLDPDPDANPTILDAQGGGRVVYVSGAISFTLEGFHITGGDAGGLGGGHWGETHHGGGGVYVISATVGLRHNQIFSNTVDSDIPFNDGSGGGLYLRYSNSSLAHNVIFGNDSDHSAGGVYFDHGSTTLQDNTIISNTYGGVHLLSGAATLERNDISGNDWDCGVRAYSSDLTLHDNSISDNLGLGSGGGLSLDACTITLTENIISGNYAANCDDWYDGGGGIYLSASDARIIGNVIENNRTYCQGGGIYLNDSTALISGNVIAQNQADLDGFGFGGGIHANSRDVTVLNNTVYSNTSSYAGGVYLAGSASAFADNRIYANSATRGGGGIYISGGSPDIRDNIISANEADYSGGGVLINTRAILVNNIIVENQAANGSSGLGIGGGSPRLLHTTLAYNQGGDGTAIYVSPDYHFWDTIYSNTVLTNTILVSHAVGISVTNGNTVAVDSVLWFDTPITVSKGITAVVSLQNQHVGDPAFLDPAAGDYHIGPTSAAIDKGANAGIAVDVDGAPRPAGLGYDLGADERLGPVLWLEKRTWQRGLNPGDLLTYTVLVTSTGIETATNVLLTDTLPFYQQPITVTTDRGSCALGAGWGAPVTCDLGDMPVGSTAQVTLTVEMTTTQPGPLPFRIRNTVQVGGDNAANDAFEDVYMHDCHVRLNGNLPEYTSVQAAVDAAQAGDTLQVAGLCTGVEDQAGLRQVAYITKTVTVRGGYNQDFTAWDPTVYTTTLDARDQGRVIYVAGTISPTLEGLYITAGEATGLGGGSSGQDAGGGVYVSRAPAIISGCIVMNNTASTIRGGEGGGLYLYNSAATLWGNVVKGNTASTVDLGSGGGLYLSDSDATLENNTVRNNIAGTAYEGSGGGLYLQRSAATLQGNTVQDNVANTADSGSGGGLYLDTSNAMLQDNTIVGNIASSAYTGDGGGVYLWASDATLQGNTVQANIASTARWGGGYGGGVRLYSSDTRLENNEIVSNTASILSLGHGGGLYLTSSDATLQGNKVQANTASGAYRGHGGGMYLGLNGDVTLQSNIIVSNTATLSSTANGQGGGIMIWGLDSFTLTNNLVAGNHASIEGSGLWVIGFYNKRTLGRLFHSTIADNQGGGQGIYTIQDCSLAFSNTIIAGHSGMGITAMAGSTVTLEATLWHDNGTNTGGNGTILTGTINVYDNPAFLDPAAGDYHIGPTSAALDRGIPAGVLTDIDGDPRPIGPGYDLGMDEAPISLPGVPTLLAPPDGTITTTQALTLTWQAVPGASPTSYNLNLDGAVVTTTGTSSATLLLAGVHTWTVRAFNAAGYSDWATAWTVEITETLPPPSNQAPYPPSNPVPDDGVTGVPLTPTLSWQGGDPDGDLVTYTLAFGASDPPPLVAAGLTITNYDPGPLDADTTYYWTVTATDGLSTTASPVWSFTTALTLCVPVSGVNLSTVTTGTIYAGDVVTFSADVTPDGATQPYTYTVYVAGMTLIYPQPGNDDPLSFSHIFPTTGTYPIEIRVWSCEMDESSAVTDVVSVTVDGPETCVDLESITILGQTVGYPGEYIFDTDYVPPDASLPINYLWDNHDVTASSTRNLGIGVHTLAVTATNCSEALVTDTHTITISSTPVCTQVAGVVLTRTTPSAMYVGDEVTFSIDVVPDEATQPYTYTVDYGDGTGPVSASGGMDPFSLTHVYTAAGAFTVEIALWNCQMTPDQAITDTLEVDVVASNYLIYLPIVLENY